MTTPNVGFVAHFFNRSNILIARFEVETMDVARMWADRYNRDPGVLGQVEFIGNYEKMSFCIVAAVQ